MVDYAVVAPGGVTDHSGDAATLKTAARNLPDGAYLWGDLDASNETDLPDVLAALGLDQFGLRGGRAAHRPKVEHHEGTVMLLVQTVWYIEDTSQVETGELAAYTDGKSLVTVRRGASDPTGRARRRLADDAELRGGGPALAVFSLLDSVASDYEDALAALSEDVGDLEKAVFSGDRKDRNEDIYFLIRETLQFQDAVGPLTPFAHAVKRRESPRQLFDLPRFREVADRLVRVDTSLATEMSLLTTVLTAHQGQIGTWQNDDMRRISAWAAIAVVPTAIAGIYGMNFQHMPELHWTFGYPLVMAVIAAICGLLYLGFKRNGWL
ncbi:magnesium and cobalt transport protein CorA [Glycomyces buryatensis]|uniref:Magnesium and cobalt transport protein CorA n=1 Tax=Glycomyces buryatensis TaxID=2570927 RepID=A0A4S8QE11_9ACTN|nr:magnesium and cobalt transport protein CorA [Glycomyces buryatensis]THV42570.1 magnesium and cobalt transport protein CorA [Glycomyces buryatensis]